MTRTLLIGASCLALAACGTAEQPAEEATTSPTLNATDMTPEKAGIFDKLFNNGVPARLALEQIHPNGGVLKVNSIQVKPTETVVNITYVNGHTRGVDLNWLRNAKRTYLLAENRKFIISPPQLNEQMEVASGATMTGDLVFIGAVPQTSQLQLVINENGSTNDSASNPKFIVDIPTTTATYSDDGSKKNLAA